MTTDVETRIRDAYRGTEPAPGFEERLREAVADAPQTGDGAGFRPRLLLPVAAAAAVAVGVGAFVLSRPATTRVVEATIPGSASDEAIVERERAENVAGLADFLKVAKVREGDWICLPYERTGVANSRKAEDFVDASPTALHRFVYRVGEEKDDEQFVSEWYGPRFAGGAILKALSVGATYGVEYEKDGKKVPVKGVGPFPRSQVMVGAPGGRSEVLDVFVGTVGPPLMLTPDDWARLGLARWEIPGKHTVMGLPCRRARVRVSIPGLDGETELIASCPAFEREKLIELARSRDAFWEHDWIEKEVVKGREGKWIVYGVDRVLGEGRDPAEALMDAEGKSPEAYHRYLTLLPRPARLEVDAAQFAEKPQLLALNGRSASVRMPVPIEGPGPFKIDWEGSVLTTADVARSLRLELAEVASDVILKDGGIDRPARAGVAWLGERPASAKAKEGWAAKGLVFVVYPTD